MMCMRESSVAKVLLNEEVSVEYHSYHQDPPTKHKHHGEEQESKVRVRNVEKVAAPKHFLHQPQSDTVPVRDMRVVEVHCHSNCYTNTSPYFKGSPSIQDPCSYLWEQEENKDT